MSVQDLVTAYADWLVRRRGLVIALALAAVAALAAFAPRVSFDTNYRIWFEDDDPYLAAYDRFIEEFGNDDMFVVAFEDERGVLRAQPMETVQRLTEQFWQLTGVIRVDSLANFQATRAVADGIEIEALFPATEPITPQRLREAQDYIEHEPLILGSLITEDQQVAILRARFAPNAINPSLPAKVYAELTTLLEAETARSGYEFHIAGGPITDQAFDQIAQADMGTLVPLVLGVLAMMLALVFRSSWGVLVPLCAAALAIAAVMGLNGLVGYKLNAITASAPHLLLGVTVATTLHLLSSFLAGRVQGLDARAAVRRAMERNLVPIVLTSLTTALGFFSFMFASIVPVKRLGFTAGFGTLVILVLSLTLVPALLTLFTRAPRSSLIERLRPGERLAAMSAGVVRRAPAVIGGWALVAVAVLAFLPTLVVDSNPVGYFDDDFWFRQSVDFLESQGSGGAVYEIVVRGRGPEAVKSVAYMRDLDRLTRYLGEDSSTAFANVYSLSTVVRNINRALHGDDAAYHVIPDEDAAVGQFLLLYSLSVPVGQDINDRINVDYSASRVTVIRPLVSSRESRRTIDEIEAWAARELGHVNIEFTGRDVLYTNMGNNVSESLLRSLLAAVATVTLLIMLIFRSLRAALVSLLPNLLPLAMVLGLMGLTGMLLDVGTIMVASVGFGIAVDDTIHFLAHYLQRRREGAEPAEAIRGTVAQIGTPIAVTSVALVAAFGMFLLADFMPNFYFGVLLSLVVLFALAADLTLLPAVLSRVDARRTREPGTSAVPRALRARS